jgi:uncharacterized protein (TIGR00369 family)
MRIPPFTSHLGIEVVRNDDGEIEIALELQPHHLNRRGVAHGGVITTMLDSALGAAVIASMPAEWWCATTSMATQFLDGVGQGRLTATGRLRRRGRHVAFAEGEVRSPRGRVVATATGTWHLWPYRPHDRGGATSSFVEVRGSGVKIRVGKILAVGRNYAKHIEEMGAPPDSPPVLFLKPASALVGDGTEIELPAGAGQVHHEVELVVVIGKRGRAIPAERAPEHVLGFAVGLDLTLRDRQTEAKQRGEPWSLSKGFDGSAPVSLVAPRDEVGDGSGLALSLDINDERRQEGSTSQMLRPVAELIAFASRWMTLDRGDLIFTGTPAGVGPVLPGDRLVAKLERVGSLSITVGGSSESSE